MSYRDVPDVFPGPGQVLVDVRAAGVCFPDLLLSKGTYQLEVPPPFVPGMEVAGVVAAASDGSGSAVGERVSSTAMLGGYAEYIAGDPESAAHFADGLAALVADGLRPPAPVRFPLADAAGALQLLDAGGVYGKLVLEP